MDKILTIIIPTYNMEALLDKCLTSLIVGNEELQKSLEVLVVIDGAKDRSSEIAHSYQDKYPHIFRVIDKENGNYGSCVNRGLREASGKYIKVLDADDSFETENVASFLEYLCEINVDAVFSDFVKVNPDGNIIETIKYNFPIAEVFTLSDFNTKKLPIVLMHGLTYRTSLVKSINYSQTEGISYTDQEWIFAPIAYSNTIAYFDKTIYKYLVGRDGQTMDPSVFEKNFWMEVKGAKVMVDTYNNRYGELSEAGRIYMKGRILWRSGIIDWSYFFIQRSTDNYELIVDYDNYLREHVFELWCELGNKQKRCGIPYLKLWRYFGHAKRPVFVKLMRAKDCIGFRRK